MSAGPLAFAATPKRPLMCVPQKQTCPGCIRFDAAMQHAKAHAIQVWQCRGDTQAFCTAQAAPLVPVPAPIQSVVAPASVAPVPEAAAVPVQGPLLQRLFQPTHTPLTEAAPVAVATTSSLAPAAEPSAAPIMDTPPVPAPPPPSLAPQPEVVLPATVAAGTTTQIPQVATAPTPALPGQPPVLPNTAPQLLPYAYQAFNRTFAVDGNMECYFVYDDASIFGLDISCDGQPVGPTLGGCTVRGAPEVVAGECSALAGCQGFTYFNATSSGQLKGMLCVLVPIHTVETHVFSLCLGPTGPFPILESQLLLTPRTPVATLSPTAFVSSGNAACASRVPSAIAG